MRPPLSPALERLRHALTDLEDAARRAIRDGREVVGYFSPLAPPAELIEATGAYPYRLLMNAGADADLVGMGVLGRDACAFCRSVMGTAATAAPPVTCVASGTACDRQRRMEDAWFDNTGIPLYVLALPRTRPGDSQRRTVARELRLLAEELGHRTGIEATEERLAAALVAGNRCRELLGQLDLLRKPDHPLLTGAEFFKVVRAYHGLPSDRFIPLAEAVLADIANREKPARAPVRILLMGPTLLDGAHEVVTLAEQTGRAAVVDDVIDSGTLGFGRSVSATDDPYDALAGQILDHPTLAAPTRPTSPLRGRLARMVAESRIDGILFRSVPFCRPWNGEPALLRNLLHVPILDVRVDGSTGQGQTATRVGAFVESLHARKRARRAP